MDAKSFPGRGVSGTAGWAFWTDWDFGSLQPPPALSYSDRVGWVVLEAAGISQNIQTCRSRAKATFAASTSKYQNTVCVFLTTVFWKWKGLLEKYPPNIFLFLFFGNIEKPSNHKEKPSPHVTREFYYFLQTKLYLPTMATIYSAVASNPLTRRGIAFPSGAD